MKSVLLLVTVLLLCGCKYDLPEIDGGSIELHSNGRVTKGELSPFQVEALKSWLDAHKTGWAFKVEDRPLEMLIFLRRRGATVATVDIRKDQMGVKNLVRPITAEDRASLLTILASFVVSKTEANQALEPTITTVTSPAAQEPRRP